MADIKALAKTLMGLTTQEALDLKNELKNTYGLEESVPQAAAPAATTPAKAEKTTFNVELTSVGDPKTPVIKAWKNMSGNASLIETKKIIDSAPCFLKENVSKDEAEAIKTELESAGAVITLK